MSDSRLGHGSHRHQPHLSQNYPSHGLAPAYPSHASHQSYSHHPARHISNGLPSAHPQAVHLGGPSDGIGPPPVSLIGNGHRHGSPGIQSGTSPSARAAKEKMDSVLSKLATANENTWMLIGAVAEQMQDQDRALVAFENALRHSPTSILALNAVASIARGRENFDKAIEYFQRILNIKQDNGEVWGSMGHCLLMKDDLPKAYTAYQQALYHLPNPKEPKLWYGIGILYDRYGSFEHAEEAFSSVLKMDPNFEKANEIYFRLGIIYKHQRKYQASLECFRYILNNPPRPLTSWDIWFQLGHVHEQDRDYEAARDAYMRVLTHQPDHAKVLQQLGWLHHQPGAPFVDQDKAVSYLTKSLETDGSDAQSWYLLGRAFMAGQRYNKAYEAYQQAVYRDGRNPTFWCSIGVLYYQISQHRDALDAYSRAIRLNPYISEVWYNLGSLYESCNNQVTDAVDAYTRAADLDPANGTIKQRLSILQNVGSNNAPLPPVPSPVDVHPSQYSAAPAGGYPPGGSPVASPRMAQIPPPMDPRDAPQGGRDLPPPPSGGELNRGHSPGPFGGAVAPPPLRHVDESRGTMARHAALAPMKTERPEARDGRNHYRDGPHRYDPAAETSSRRHADPAGSPQRRDDGYHDYQHYAPHPGPLPREREREEWERTHERARGPLGPPDSRGTSPRLQGRAPHPSQDLRRQPSPRLPPGYRAEYARPGEGSHPYFGYEVRSRYPTATDTRERGYDRRHDEPAELKAREPTPNGNSRRRPSISNENRPDDLRAASPAVSAGSRAGSKRKVGRKEDEKVTTKRTKDDKPASKKGSGEKKPLKVTLRPGSGEGEAPSPRGSVTSSPSGSAPSSTSQQTPQHPAAPSREVDEDYDEGAADALMTLHGDRPTLNAKDKDDVKQFEGSKTISPAAVAIAGIKRAGSPASSHAPKKAKSDGVSPKPSPVHSNPDRVRTVIEVLNVPRMDSPHSRPTSSIEPSKPAEAREAAYRRRSNSTLAAKEAVPAAELSDVPAPHMEFTPPVSLIQTVVAADAVVEASGKLDERREPYEPSEERDVPDAAARDGDVVMAVKMND